MINEGIGAVIHAPSPIHAVEELAAAAIPTDACANSRPAIATFIDHVATAYS